MMPEVGSHAFPIRLQHETIVIGVPVYNEEMYIEDTLKSIQAQSWTDFAVLISDNASSDESANICKQFCANDSRFHFISQERNIGSAENFNFLRKSTQSPLFMWLGAHDVITPGFLGAHIQKMHADETIVLSYSNFAYIDEKGAIVSTQAEPNTAHFSNSPVLRSLLTLKQTGMCVQINQVIRRSALEGRDFTGVWGTDRVMLASLSYRGKFNVINDVLYHYRQMNVRDVDYMERLTGRKVAISRSELARESRDFFRSIAKGAVAKAIVGYASDAIIQHRFGARPRNMLAYLWDAGSAVRAWFR